MSEQEMCENECEECEGGVCVMCGYDWDCDPFYWVESREGFNATMLKEALDKESPEFRNQVSELVKKHFDCKYFTPRPVYRKLLELMSL